MEGHAEQGDHAGKTRHVTSYPERSSSSSAQSSTAPSVTILSNKPTTTDAIATSTTIPFMRRPSKFNTDAVLKCLGDHPGHFVIGVIGAQGVGKSTVLSWLARRPSEAFSTQSAEVTLKRGHKTVGIDIHVTPERTILLDTEPLFCSSVLEQTLQQGSLNGVLPDVWLEMDSLYTIVFLLAVCNVVVVVMDGTELDLNLLRSLEQAEMLKFSLPEFPLISASSGLEQDTNDYPHTVFVCNKCTDDEFIWKRYQAVHDVLSRMFSQSSLKTRGLVSFGNVLPAFTLPADQIQTNLFFLPRCSADPLRNDVHEHLTDNAYANNVEPFPVLAAALRDQLVGAPRKQGKRGLVSEKEWFRNAMKTFELVHKSEYVSEFMQTLRKLRSG